MSTEAAESESHPVGLKSGALRAVDVVVMALASSGPIQSVAVSMAAILATVAYAGFLPILICFVPMLGIALGYERLHAWQPSAGLVLLFVIYSVAILAFQGVASMDEMQDHAANILAFIGERIGGSFWGKVMIIAVLGGTLASLLAAIISASRIGFAMGRDRVIPSWFGKVSPKYRTPWNGTILFGLLNIVFLWGSTLIGAIGDALSNIVSTLGLMAAMFYLLTAVTAIWCYPRRQITGSAGDFVLGGLLPGLGAAFMAFVIVYSIASGSLTGIELTFGVALALAGLVLSVISSRVGRAPYYSSARESR